MWFAVGSLLSLLYAIGIRFPDFDPRVKTIIVGVGLVASTALSYVVGAKRDPLDQAKSLLHGIKTFVAGVVIYTLAMLFVVNLNGTLNPPPVYPRYSANYPSVPPNYYYKNSPTQGVDEGVTTQDLRSFEQYERELTIYNAQSAQAQKIYETKRKEHERNSFIIVIAVSFVYLVIGVLVRGVAALSVGMIAAGLPSIIYTLVISFDELGRAAMAIVTGIGVIVFWFSVLETRA